MKKVEFNAEVIVNEIVVFIKKFFSGSLEGKNVVIGMSGGKDSTVTAALLAKALGPDRVIGVALPDANQSLNDADKISEKLGIRYMCVPIDGVTKAFGEAGEWSVQTEQNIPPRVRMTMLYAIAQSNNALVVNTCNLSEDYIGYATKYGDAAGDFSLFANLTVTEILAIGDCLGLNYEWVHKTPDDGLPHSCSDEEKFGFTYATLDKYIRDGVEPEDQAVKEKIDRMHKQNLHKLKPMPSFHYVYLPLYDHTTENN